MLHQSLYVWLIACCLAAQSGWAAQNPAAKPDFQIRDLIFKIENLGGQVLNLQLQETATEIRIELAADVLFDFDKAEVRADAQNALKQAAAIIKEKAKGTVRVEGHTDAKGADSYNQKLSDRRASSIKNWLVQKEGMRNSRFSTTGFGAKRPVASNTKPDGSDDPEGRQKNRRVEIIVIKK